jgi:hypothetical protein
VRVLLTFLGVVCWACHEISRAGRRDDKWQGTCLPVVIFYGFVGKRVTAKGPRQCCGGAVK